MMHGTLNVKLHLFL
jgi:hypothetical protein